MSSLPLHLTGRRTEATWRSSQIDCIIPEQLYLGSLTSALSPESLQELSITHIVSVCSDYPSTGPSHLNVDVKDTEDEDLLVHMSETCNFIQDAINSGGRVFVHCVYGVSRSATIVSAYLMMARRVSPSAAIRFVKECRPGIDPNPGFIRQLAVFSACSYDLSSSHPIYTEWKMRQYVLSSFSGDGQPVILDPIKVIKGKIYITTRLPKSPNHTDRYLSSHEITHLFTIAPSRVDVSSAPPSAAKHQYFGNSYSSVRDPVTSVLLPILRETTAAIQAALAKNEDNRILLYSTLEDRLGLVVCAYLITSQNINADEAFAIFLEALPLFTPTRSFLTHLEAYANPGMGLGIQVAVGGMLSDESWQWLGKMKKVFGS